MSDRTDSGESNAAAAAGAQATKASKKENKNKGQKAKEQQEHPVPAFKVGRNVMYDQFVPGYDAIMKRHDCSAIERVFAQTLQLHQRRGAASIRIADLGCGTGRGSKLLINAILSQDGFTTVAASSAQSNSLLPRFQLCGVDKSAAMVDAYVAAMREFLSSRIPEGAASSIRSLPVRCAPWEANNTITTTAATEAAAAAAATAASSTIWGAVASLEEFCVERSSDNEAAGVDGNAGAAASAAAAAESAAAVATTVVPFEPDAHVDVVVCAWALSHVASAQWGGERWHANVRRCVSAMESNIDPATGGHVVVIETLGTDTEVPTRHSSLHDFLAQPAGQGGGGFAAPAVVRTDYVFSSREEGERCVRFFFGDEMRARFAARCAKQQQQQQQVVAGDGDESAAASAAPVFVLPECTGIWIKHVPPSAAATSAAADAVAPQRRERSNPVQPR